MKLNDIVEAKSELSMIRFNLKFEHDFAIREKRPHDAKLFKQDMDRIDLVMSLLEKELSLVCQPKESPKQNILSTEDYLVLYKAAREA